MQADNTGIVVGLEQQQTLAQQRDNRETTERQQGRHNRETTGPAQQNPSCVLAIALHAANAFIQYKALQ